MTASTVEVLEFRLAGVRLAVELQRISSVLAAGDAEGMRQLDPRPHLLAAGNDPSGISPLGEDHRLGLLDGVTPPTAVVLGEIVGASSWRADDLLAVPEWIAAMMPPVFLPACAHRDQKVVWLLDLDTLDDTPAP